MLKRLFQPEHGHRALDQRVLALNLSYVLHERSDSDAVRSAVRAARRHARIIDGLGDSCASPATSNDYDPSAVTHWLTATLGLPQLLADALGTSTERLIRVDAETSSSHRSEFFRATAVLALPPHNHMTIGVAALVLRPDRQTTHLTVTGVHDWPADRDGTIRSLERLIQAHAGQWMPSRSLWPAPAESLLPNEVY